MFSKKWNIKKIFWCNISIWEHNKDKHNSQFCKTQVKEPADYQEKRKIFAKGAFPS